MVILAFVDNLEHIFGWILVIIALATSFVLKVVQKHSRVLSDRAKVHSLPPFGQEE
jgi:type II secretory pathway component PulF